MRKKRRVLFSTIAVGCLVVALSVAAIAAYFAKGVFKDVFVNKMDYFSADVLYNIRSIDADKLETGSAGVRRLINIFNHDVSSGDYNGFDITFDVYMWLDGEMPAGKTYTLYDPTGDPTPIAFTDASVPILRDLTLQGGKRSTVTLEVDFDFTKEDDLSAFPGLHVVAVPSAPKRMSGSLLGAVIRPTRSEAFAINFGFESTGGMDQYAAFTYRATTVGNVPDTDKLAIKWNSQVLTLIRVDEEDPSTVIVQEISDGIFDRMIQWNMESNHTNTLVFFRNTQDSDVWSTATPSWEWLHTQVTTEQIKNS